MLRLIPSPARVEGRQQEAHCCSQRAVLGVWAACPPSPWFLCPCSRDCAALAQLPCRVKMFHLRQTLVSLSACTGSALSAHCLAWRHLFCVQAFERKNSPQLSTDMERLLFPWERAPPSPEDNELLPACGDTARCCWRAGEQPLSVLWEPCPRGCVPWQCQAAAGSKHGLSHAHSLGAQLLQPLTPLWVRAGRVWGEMEPWGC